MEATLDLKRSLSPTNISMYDMNKENMTKSVENLMSESHSTKYKAGRMRRSMTLKDVSEFKFVQRSKTNLSFEKIKQAKEKVDEAVKKGKIFQIIGPYHRVRKVLRNKGWVEKFYYDSSQKDSPNTSIAKKSKSILSKSIINSEKPNATSDDDDDDDDVGDGDYDDDGDIMGDGLDPSLPPWEEEDGIYGLMSRMLRNNQPNLYWTLRKNQVDYRNLRRDQIINHHSRAGYLTTKTGLARSLQELRWFDKNIDVFFPRCFIISTLDEKNAFIENFKLTACISMLKTVVSRAEDNQKKINEDDADGDIKENDELKNGSFSLYIPENNTESIDTTRDSESKSNRKIMPKIRYVEPKIKEDHFIEYKYLEMATAYCEFYLKEIEHEDIDKKDFLFCWSLDWDDFLANYYKVVNDNYRIRSSESDAVLEKCKDLCNKFRAIDPQFNMDGNRNVWILKPGAKSRGRGITCYNHLNDMLKLVSNTVIIYETRFIVQKYIERPFLVYNTKFDIRQWFVVTDWNPLTVWWYKDSYLRFCSQQFTLDDFNEAVHLSNNSIQHKYLNGPRSSCLPEENMWDWKQFDAYLKKKGHGNAWTNKILPAMKESVLDSLLCVQESVEWRKNSFEMYGADFMISDGDLQPWLIEINSSPCMAASTSVTAILTDNVINDVFKVILDRRENKNADTGRFELLYKQLSISVPPYIGVDLKLHGTSIKNPFASNKELSVINTERRSSRQYPDLFYPKKSSVEEPIMSRKKGISDIPTTKSSTLRESRVKVNQEYKKNNEHKRSRTISSTIITRPNFTKSRLSNNKNSLQSTYKYYNPESSRVQEVDEEIDDNNRSNSDYSGVGIENNIAIDEMIHDVKSPIVDIDDYNNEIEDVFINDTSLIQKERKGSGNKKENSRKKKKSPPSSSNSQQKSDNLINLNIHGNQNGHNQLLRQYKLPTKVEVINFSMAQNFLNDNHNHSLNGHRSKHNSQTNRLLIRGNPNTSSTSINRKPVKNKFKNSDLSQQMIIQHDDYDIESSISSISIHQAPSNSAINSRRIRRTRQRHKTIREFTLQPNYNYHTIQPIDLPFHNYRSKTLLLPNNNFNKFNLYNNKTTPSNSSSFYCLPQTTNYKSSLTYLLQSIEKYHRRNININNSNNCKTTKKSRKSSK